MSTDRVSEGDFGTTIEFTVTDEDGVARNFTSITLTLSEIRLADPAGIITPLTAAFKNPPGADGIFTAVVLQADKFTPDGTWTAWVRYEGTGFAFSTVPQPLIVTNIPGE